MSSPKEVLRVALLQLKATTTPEESLTKAESYIQVAKQNGATLIVLPEYFKENAESNNYKSLSETIPDGKTCVMLSRAAKNNSVYVVGGTFIENDGSNLYNTCTVWNPSGEMIAKFRKVHLFDINIPGKINYQESNDVMPGSKLATFQINDIKLGIGVCHDLRFEEMAKLYRHQNCKILVYPSDFTGVTGPLHYELLQKARAADNQLFVLGCNRAKSENIGYGYSQVTNPWGEILVKADQAEQILYCDLNVKMCDEVRQQLPVYNQRRTDIYDTVSKSS